MTESSEVRDPLACAGLAGAERSALSPPPALGPAAPTDPPAGGRISARGESTGVVVSPTSLGLWSDDAVDAMSFCTSEACAMTEKNEFRDPIESAGLAGAERSAPPPPPALGPAPSAGALRIGGSAALGWRAGAAAFGEDDGVASASALRSGVGLVDCECAAAADDSARSEFWRTAVLRVCNSINPESVSSLERAVELPGERACAGASGTAPGRWPVGDSIGVAGPELGLISKVTIWVPTSTEVLWMLSGDSDHAEPVGQCDLSREVNRSHRIRDVDRVQQRARQ